MLWQVFLLNMGTVWELVSQQNSKTHWSHTHRCRILIRFTFLIFDHFKLHKIKSEENHHMNQSIKSKIIKCFTTLQRLSKSLFYYEYYIQPYVTSRAWLASSVYLRLCCLHQWGSMGVWHRHNAVSSNCDRDVMRVAIPMQSALFAPPPHGPLRCPAAAHHRVTSGHPLWGPGRRGTTQVGGHGSQIFWLGRSDNFCRQQTGWSESGERVNGWCSSGCLRCSLAVPSQIEWQTKEWERVKAVEATQSACLTCSPMWECTNQERELLYVSVSQHPVGLLDGLTCLCCGNPTWIGGEGSAGRCHTAPRRKPPIIHLSLCLWAFGGLLVCPIRLTSSCPSCSFCSFFLLLFCTATLWFTPGCEGLQLGGGGGGGISWGKRGGRVVVRRGGEQIRGADSSSIQTQQWSVVKQRNESVWTCANTWNIT